MSVCEVVLKGFDPLKQPHFMYNGYIVRNETVKNNIEKLI